MTYTQRPIQARPVWHGQRNRPISRPQAPAAGRIAGLRRKLDDLLCQVQLIGQLEESIGTLEAELRYLDAVLAVPVPGEQPVPQYGRTAR